MQMRTPVVSGNQSGPGRKWPGRGTRDTVSESKFHPRHRTSVRSPRLAGSDFGRTGLNKGIGFYLVILMKSAQTIAQSYTCRNRAMPTWCHGPVYQR